MVIQEIKISPNSKQRSAIEHPPAPLMILAGAGTGKTFTLENRIVYLIKEYKVDREQCLLIDDQQENIQAAREFGFHTLLFDQNDEHGVREVLKQKDLI